ncbi:TPA: DUF5801 repeats-in-toxin domain-containing protein, partial [Klebsiella pneumoniae]
TLAGSAVQGQFTGSYGADGPGSTVYSLALKVPDTGGPVGSGLFAVDPSAASGKGAEIQLSQSGNVISGKVGAVTYFTLTINPTDGAVTLDLVKNIWHSNTSSADDAETLSLGSGVLTLVKTMTDGDGDSDSASIDLGAAG